jgi:uncharacterized membrane protein
MVVVVVVVVVVVGESEEKKIAFERWAFLCVPSLHTTTSYTSLFSSETIEGGKIT